MTWFELFKLDKSSTGTATGTSGSGISNFANQHEEDENRNKKTDRCKMIDDLISEMVAKRIVSWGGVVMYGLCISLAGHYVGWTVSFYAGFWKVFGSTFIILTSTGCLMLCIAEMTAALPFSGGTYGVARVTLGHLPGFLVGTCEVLQTVLYVSFTVGSLAKYVTTFTGYNEKFEPLYWAVFYLTIGTITSNHRTLFWRSMLVFGIFMCVMLLLYCSITRTEDVNFIKYTNDPDVANLPYHDEVYHFFKQLPLPSFFFNLSIKLLPLACREAKNPTSDVPMAMYIVYAVSIVSAFSILFCASSIAPGVSVLRQYPTAPLSFGFSSIFNVSMEHVVVFTMLAQYASCLGFTFAFTQEMAALSKSGFLWNSRKWGFVPDRYDNVVSLLVGCGFGYLLNFLTFYWHHGIRLYTVSFFRLLGYSINLVVFVTYIAFRIKFPTLMIKFRSPLGVPGAVYGLVVSVVVCGCIGALSNVGNHWAPFVMLACFLAIWSLPFALYYRYHLNFSEEEGTVLFVAYVIQANKERRMRRQQAPKSYSIPRKAATHPIIPQYTISEEEKKDERENTPNEDIIQFEKPLEMKGLYSDGLKMDYIISKDMELPDASIKKIRASSINQEGIDHNNIPESHRTLPKGLDPINIIQQYQQRQSPSPVLSRVSSCTSILASVLVAELGYERDIMGRYHTEIEEYFASEAAAEEEEALEQLHPQGDDAV